MRGFTLLELLLSVAIIVLVAGSGIALTRELQFRNDLDIAAVMVVQSMRRAQALAQGVEGDARWGVMIQTGQVTLFRGNSFSQRDPNFDEVFTLSGVITPGGITEVVFGRFNGDPEATGTITLTGVNSEARTLTINAKGTISY